MGRGNGKRERWRRRAKEGRGGREGGRERGMGGRKGWRKGEREGERKGWSKRLNFRNGMG